VIADRTGVNQGTISRWIEKHGWTRPPGAWPSTRRPGRRYVPVLVGRALAQRLRIQAERLVSEIEEAPAVDPAALAEALVLLERARAEQQIRRTRRRRPPTPEELGPVEAAEATRRAEAKAARSKAQLARKRERRREREILRELAKPAPGRFGPDNPPFVYKCDRSEAVRIGWRTRYANMRAAGRTLKKDR
jgi:hypothetical protein